jgi:pyruvate/2-oxoglutarate dehydrogenase complex dihydrolipoamide acyltransferase (E2) component
MQSKVVLPDLGAEPVVLSVWYAEPGETVFEGDRLVEVLVEGATFDVASPTTGKLIEKYAYTKDCLLAGQVLGIVESEETG